MSELPQPPKRKRANGRTLGMGPAQLDAAAKVTMGDDQSARDWFNKHCPRKLRGILDATVERSHE